MKFKLFIFFLIFIESNFVFCQEKTPDNPAKIYKSYLNKDGKRADSSHAESYLLYKRVSDSLWQMKLFTMDNVIQYEGSYKDETLNVPNGKFIYYYKLPANLKENRTDTLNYIKTVGYFENGFKVGRWTYYFYNGNKETVETYLNNALNGPFLTYNYNPNTIFIKGSYIDNKKDGDWVQLSIHGNIIKTENYRNDELQKTSIAPSSYVPAVMSGKFYDYLLKNINSIIRPRTGGIIIIRCEIRSEGILFNPQIFKGTINPEIDQKILAMMTNAPKWKPAYNMDTKSNIQDFVEVRIAIQNYFKIDIQSLENEIIDYYQLMH
ncbi:MAG: toxin-antitoxin system YwqK family antitoxin [Mucilaginibacter sp.]